MMLKDLTKDLHLSLFKNDGSLTHENGIKDAVNMEDLTCLLATVRTLVPLKDPQKKKMGLRMLILVLNGSQLARKKEKEYSSNVPAIKFIG